MYKKITLYTLFFIVISNCSINAEPTVEVLNCPNYIINSDTYELKIEVKAGNEDIVAYYFRWLYENGEWPGFILDEFYEVELDAEKINFPKSNSTEIISHKLTNLTSLSVGTYILEVAVQSQEIDESGNYRGDIFNGSDKCKLVVSK